MKPRGNVNGSSSVSQLLICAGNGRQRFQEKSALLYSGCGVSSCGKRRNFHSAPGSALLLVMIVANGTAHRLESGDEKRHESMQRGGSRISVAPRRRGGFAATKQEYVWPRSVLVQAGEYVGNAKVTGRRIRSR